jgi:hypothetical protein
LGCLALTYHPRFELVKNGSVKTLTSKKTVLKSRSDYVFGFNGQEKVDYIAGTGNHYTAPNWEYDPRTGRRWNLDPVDQISISNYAAFRNNPILFNDFGGDYPINIHVRSFAPFPYFGPGNLWKGDGTNRRFTTNAASSRISMVTNYETETKVARSTALGAWSSSKYGAFSYSKAYLNSGKQSVTSQGSNIDIHLYGKNEAFYSSPAIGVPSPGGRLSPTWDIDIHNKLNISTSDGVLSISGQVRGDKFPSAEAFVSDDFGTAIFLGVAPTSGDRQWGPLRELAGDRNLPMIDVNVRIAVGDNGAFQGVYSQDKEGNEIVVSPEAYNRRYQNQSPVKGQ